MTTWLHEQRLAAVREVVRECGARSILDLGCGDGDLLVRLLAEPQVERIIGVDLCLDPLPACAGGWMLWRSPVLHGSSSFTVRSPTAARLFPGSTAPP